MIPAIIMTAAVCLMIYAAGTFDLPLFVLAWWGLAPLAVVESVVKEIRAGGGPRSTTQ